MFQGFDSCQTLCEETGLCTSVKVRKSPKKLFRYADTAVKITAVSIFNTENRLIPHPILDRNGRGDSMNTIECIKKRRSIRQYEPRKVEHEKIEQLIDCARWAPSWNNCKAVRYTVIEKEEELQTIAHTLVAPENVHIVENAPLLIALSIVQKRSGYERDGSTSTNKGASWEMFDTGVACQNICLAAEELGLGTVIMASFDEDGITKFIDLPEDETIIALVACGYPARVPNAPRRKEVSEILRYH